MTPIRRLVAAFTLHAVAASVPAQLSGHYTIHPLRPVSATNFQNLYSAVDALDASGVSGPVVFELYDDGGPFTDPMTFYSANHPVFGGNLSLGNGQCVLRLGAWAGVSASQRVTFRAAPGESPVIDATGKACGVYFHGADYVTLERLEIRGAVFDAVSLYTSGTQNALGNHIIGCLIRNCGGVGVLTYGNSGAVNDTLIACNVFSNLMTTGGGAFSGFIRDGYVAGRRDNNTQILFNTFLVTTLAGGSTTTPPWVIGSYPSGSSYTAFTKIEGNLIVKSVANGLVYNFQTASATTAPTLPASCDWNDHWTPGGGNFAKGAATTYATLAAWQAAVSKDLTSLSVDPQIGGCETPAYRLGDTSPCIDVAATTSTALALLTDAQGWPRIGALDIGADEWQGAAAACVASVGSGGFGATGSIAALVTAQPPYLGNSAFTFEAPRTPAGSAVALFVAFGLEPVPVFYGAGNRSYLSQADLASLMGGPYYPLFTGTGVPGGGLSLAAPIPASPGMSGVTLHFQASVDEPGSPLGYVLTNALSLTFY
jgi:hypothetical protein